MRNIDKLLLLPLFATLALSCSSPTSLQTSEYDDVYYSKKDQTVITDNTLSTNQQPEQNARTAAADGAVANPEYSEKSSGGGQIASGTDYYSPDYYDENDYYYASRIRRFNAPYRGFSYYDFAYTDYYWYNRNPLYYGRSIYADPFYAYNPYFYPCYTCYGYPGVYGSINIIIGRPYYSRWGWGDPYYGAYNRGYYGGYGGYYGGYYGRNYANSGWYRNDNYSRKVQYGPRLDRSNVPVGDNSKAPNRQRRDLSSGGGLVSPGDNSSRPARSTRGREDMSNPGGGISQPEAPRTGTRGREDRSSELERSTDIVPSDRVPANSPRRSTRGRADQLETSPSPAEERVIQPRTGNEYPDRPTRDRRTFEPQPSDQPVNQPRREERSEPRYQPQPRQEQQRSEPRYQPRQEQRSEPRYQPRQEPTYQAPQRQERSYSPPSTPSYNPPSRPSGGGSSDGGGGGRSSRGRGN
ncbi:MAG: hypothetical protein ACO1O1_08615 [Adhaeribacter sp.]